MADIKKVTESLAEFEHEQWSTWARHFIAEATPENIERWKRQATTPYEQLNEDEKEKDRIWARKALQILGIEGDTLYSGRFIQVKQRKGWEYVERTKASGITAILAITDDQKLVLVEQFRPPVNKRVLEIPAGLAGDILGEEGEAFATAARRELLEETGYEAASMNFLTEGPASAGLSTEVITFFKATGLKKVEAGGGDSSENIQIHEIPLKGIHEWIENRRKEGVLIDYKIYAALFFVK